jgi:hypothetical protein
LTEIFEVRAETPASEVAAFQFMVNPADSDAVAASAAPGVFSPVNMQVRLAVPQNRAGAQTGLIRVQFVASSIA